MKLDTQLIARIREDLKINIYEAKIWTSLLNKGISTAAELSEVSGVPRSRCYDVLESLEKKGFIIMKIGKPIKYIAIKPEEVIEKLKKETIQEEQRLLNGFDNIKESEVFRDLNLLYSSGVDFINAEDLSDYVAGRSTIQRRIKDMLNNAKKSVMIYTTEKGYERKAKILKNHIPKLKKNKVKVYLNAPVENNRLKDVIFTNKDLPLRFVSIDGKEILFTITDDSANPNEDSAVHVKSEFFANAMEMMLKK